MWKLPFENLFEFARKVLHCMWSIDDLPRSGFKNTILRFDNMKRLNIRQISRYKYQIKLWRRTCSEANYFPFLFFLIAIIKWERFMFREKSSHLHWWRYNVHRRTSTHIYRNSCILISHHPYSMRLKWLLAHFPTGIFHARMTNSTNIIMIQYGLTASKPRKWFNRSQLGGKKTGYPGDEWPLPFDCIQPHGRHAR